ncbi:MAG: hypothetical protein Q8O67_19610 [Deltaproteobacteria bacterium]|nr:hypothetical protein [Deltaproteobacteria bacterium]
MGFTAGGLLLVAGVVPAIAAVVTGREADRLRSEAFDAYAAEFGDDSVAPR